jgi:hypothetical protein
MAEITDGMSRGVVVGMFPVGSGESESEIPHVRAAQAERLRYISENNRRGRETERQRIAAEELAEKHLTASQLAQRENVSPRLYSLILKLETEKVKK